MSTVHPARLSLPDAGARTSESAVDYALTLLLAEETESSLRWGAAALEIHPGMPGALLVTARALDQMGRSRAAIDALRLAVTRAIDAGDLALAVAATDDLRLLGVPAGDSLDALAGAYCRGSARLEHGQGSSRVAQYGDFLQPLSPFLSGPPLASKATQIVHSARRNSEASVPAEAPSVPALPFFSALSYESLRKILAAFQVITVPAGHRLIEEGRAGAAAYFVARGEVEVGRRATYGDHTPSLALARLGAGAFFGEMSLLSQIPSGASVTATRPSVLLVAEREVLLTLAAKRPELAVQLAAHCRRSALANLGRSAPLVAALPSTDRATLVERMEMRVFDAGHRLARDGADAEGLHFIVSGDVAIVVQEHGERVLLATLGAGETIGEVELVLCQRRYADAIAVRPTATLFLSRDEYRALAQDHPAILHGLYAVALRRHTETKLALQAGSGTIATAELVEDEEPTVHQLPARHSTRVGRTPPPLPPSHRAPPREDAETVFDRPPTLSPMPPVVTPSLAPAALSTRAPAPALSGRGVSVWLAAGGAAVGAAAASIVLVLAFGNGGPLAQAAAGGPVRGTAETAGTTHPAPLQAAEPAPAAVPPVPPALAASPALKTNPKGKPPIPPRFAARDALRPAPVAAPAVAGSVATSVPASSTAVAGARAAADAKAPGAQAFVSRADDFGGRE